MTARRLTAILAIAIFLTPPAASNSGELRFRTHTIDAKRVNPAAAAMDVNGGNWVNVRPGPGTYIRDRHNPKEMRP